jgi:hypothetical protein
VYLSSATTFRDGKKLRDLSCRSYVDAAVEVVVGGRVPVGLPEPVGSPELVGGGGSDQAIVDAGQVVGQVVGNTRVVEGLGDSTGKPPINLYDC